MLAINTMSENTTPPPSLNTGTMPDMDLKVELVVNDKAEAFVFHDKPFKKDLSWIEFDLDNSKLDFVMEDGDLRNFGIAVDPKLSKYLQNSFQILMVLMDEQSGEAVEGEYYPLIIHRV